MGKFDLKEVTLHSRFHGYRLFLSKAERFNFETPEQGPANTPEYSYFR